MRRVFLWLSGADPVILDDCGPLRRTETIRFAGLGALTVVPAVLGCFAMTYAISTLTARPLIFVPAGLVWGCIVLAIDRYLVATLHKSALPGHGRTVPIIARLLFAVLVGIAVAHPLVLLWFNDSLTQTIAENRRDAVQARQQQAERDVAAEPEPAVSSTALIQRRAARLSEQDCLRRLKTYEQSNVQKALPCGISSGEPECGPRCQDLQRQITAVQGEIAALDRQIAAAAPIDATANARYQSRVAVIRSRAAADIADIEAHFSHDYLARVSALTQLEKNSPQVLIVELFLIVFFVFVDILPLVMKITTPTAEYEQVRDTRLERAVATQLARRNTIGPTEEALALMNARAERLIGEIEVITQAPMDVLASRERHLAEFERLVRRLREVATGTDEAITETDILRARDLDRQAFTRSMADTQTFITQP
ncbi:DUF4407 domain-containing protein [Actinoplanes sp. NPDC026619]|uniref:DUF4407 domain-containing protein n=1 Tax=Actinoplanes sp. NPDC026619 TaxID=3155798 RepID=UPI0033CCF4A9